MMSGQQISVFTKNKNMSSHIRTIFSYLSICALLLVSLSVVGQGLEDPSELDPAVPVDGGISLLLAVGAALGGRRLMGKSPKEAKK
jgi:hypothetical protein